MDLKEFKSGTWQKGYQYKYFLPEKINHPFVWTDGTINDLLEKSSLRLGELNSFSRLVPDTGMFIMMHVFKEAVASSRVEGTRTEIEEALFSEKEINPEQRDDWQEVNNYVQAMNLAIESLEKIPLSSRLMRETHKRLLDSVRGKHRQPGEFRTSQNWIGGATLSDAVFVPPAHTEVPALMSDLELFLHNEEIKVPHLIRIAIAHYQFETIHPFLDGNGRIGRLLITLYLVSKGVLDKPLLYLSEFIEKNRALYYDNLMAAREHNDLIRWIKFFLVAVHATAEKGCQTLSKILEYKQRVESEHIPTLGKRIPSAQRLFLALFSKPVLQARIAGEITGLSPKAVNDLLRIFVQLGILKEVTGFQRNRIFVFRDYIEMFR
jgi:Fic family protein